jgi:dTDP-4-dehydrorhamnose reductase
VHATLDLLIDGEHGIWHLANQGAVTWYEFGRLVARAGGMSEDLVMPCSWREIWQPALRPSYSVLGSTRGWPLPSLAHGINAYIAEIAVAASEETPRCVSW